jgi:hypothetical protein
MRCLQTQGEKSLRSAIDQGLFPELLKEAPKLSPRRAPLFEIHEMDPDTAFSEEALGLSNVSILFHAKDLNFHNT